MALQQNKGIDSPEPAFRRRFVSLTLAAFLFVGSLCAGGALFLKYRLEHARAFSTNAIRERVGLEFTFDTVRAEGVRTLHVSGLHIAAPVPGWGKLSVDIASLRLSFSFAELLRGQVAIGDATIRGGHFVFTKAESEPEARVKAGRRFGDTGLTLPVLPPIALIGSDCTVDFFSGPEADPVRLRDLSFSLSNRPDIPEIKGGLTAALCVGDNTASLSVAARYRRADSFDAALRVGDITTEHVKQFADIPDGIEGRASVQVDLWGMADQRMAAGISATIDELGLPMPPAPVARTSGALDALVWWDGVQQTLTVHTLTLDTTLGRLTGLGRIDLAGESPVLGVNATLEALPWELLSAQYMPDAIAEMGLLDVTVAPDAQVEISAAGPVSAPDITARLVVPEITIGFSPKDAALPRGQITLERADLIWDDFGAPPRGMAYIKDGTVSAAAFGVEASGITGVVVSDESGISLRPIAAHVSDRPWSGAATYVPNDGEIQFELSGALTDIEETPLHDLVEKLWLAGEIAFRARGTYRPGGRLYLKAGAEITRGMVAFEWWLRKPIGVGASIHDIEVLIEPGKKLEVKGEAAIEDTRILATFSYVPHDGRWETRHIRVDVPHLEINSAGKCIQIPYTARGTFCRDGYYEWRGAGSRVGDNIATLGGFFDYVSFQPHSDASPLICRDAEVAVTITNIEDVERSAELVVHAGEAHVPPFGEEWLLPIGSTDPEYIEKYPEEPRPWTYKLTADTISVPPWQGNQFAAEVYNNEEETGFNFFRAAIGEGHIEGTHRHEKEDNVLHLQATWENIPAVYLIRHLELPEILAGAISGDIAYVVDHDDPRATLRADGHFNIVRGHFIAEELREVFTDALGGGVTELHPASLTFNEVASQLRIEGDKIHTDNLRIVSEGMTITGNGTWIMEGDLDYRVNIAVTPDLAEQIPVLRDNFNVQGFRMTQRDIELGFHITGPTFQPTGQLAGLPPMGVTLVSGAADMTGEAMRLLDMPRQMFMSIFRTGGGILGAGRTQQQQQQ